MRVFLTGATGTIGSAILRAFHHEGHDVHGLTRSGRLPFGWTVAGDLRDPASYEAAAVGADVVIHAAFESPSLDRRAIFDLLHIAQHALLIYTSGTWVLGETYAGDEDAPTENPAEVVSWRPTHERFVLEAGGAVIRPGMVFGGGRGLVSHYFEEPTYIGAGSNRVSLVHRDDLAQLYLLVARKRATGIFHGVDGNIQTIRDIARAASFASGRAGTTRSIPLEEGRAKLGPVADALCLDQIIVAPRSVRLGWRAKHAPFVESARDVYDEWICSDDRVSGRRP